MRLIAKLIGLGLLGLALLVSSGTTQEKKEGKGKTVSMPAGFKDLGLTAEQVVSVRKIISEYKVKIDDLKKQIKDLETKEKQDYFKVLTDDQRKKYLESKGVDTKSADTKKDAKKDGDKK